MFLAALYRIASPEISDGFDSPFSDVSPGNWYYATALWAFKSGIVTGRTNGSLGAEDSVTRQEAAVLMYRLAAYLRADVSSSGDMLSGFEDGAEVSAYARTALEWAVERGIITGVSDSELSPGGTVTRAQASAMLQRVCGVLND